MVSLGVCIKGVVEMVVWLLRVVRVWEGFVAMIEERTMGETKDEERWEEDTKVEKRN
jgi:hypothetical protein